MKFHEYANLFPMMPDSDIVKLAEDIKEKGQSDSIITLDGQILDGRNRYRACQMNGINPRCEEYAGDDPLGFVISHNLHRRHLSESQRAMVAAKWAKLKMGHRPPSPIGGGAKETKTRDEAAELLNVGTSSIDRAKKVIKDAPGLVEKIESGEMSVNAAYVTTKRPRQEEELEAVVVDETRPTKRMAKFIPDDARRLWILAKTDLDKILKEDKSREEVLREVIKYAQNRIDTNK